MFNRRTLLLIFTLGITILSCQKEPDINDLENTNCRLTKIIQGTHNGGGDDTTFLFHYDNTGKINLIDDIQWGDTFSISLGYDNLGRLIRVTDEDAWSHESNYSYNPDGKLGSITYCWPDTQKVVFDYTGQELPAKLTFYDKNATAWDYSYEKHYTYTNGNVTTVETIFNGRSTKQYLEYDTVRTNELFRQLALISFRTVRLGFYEAYFYFNKNMMKKYKNEETGTEYNASYTMDKGRIVKIQYTPPDNSWLEANNYFFECK
jgi:YD repeat-containing protein